MTCRCPCRRAPNSKWKETLFSLSIGERRPTTRVDGSGDGAPGSNPCASSSLFLDAQPLGETCHAIRCPVITVISRQPHSIDVKDRSDCPVSIASDESRQEQLTGHAIHLQKTASSSVKSSIPYPPSS